MPNSIDSGTAFYPESVMKRLVLNADNFGINKDFNRAVLNGSNNGFLKSTGIVVNGNAYNAAINEIIPECPKLGVGISLNITHGQALTKCVELTDKDNNFNLNFFKLYKFRENKELLKEIEKEFRAQLKIIPGDIKITHIDSVDNVHAIPQLFEIVCNIAKEYNIPYVITHNERYSFRFNYINLLKPGVIMNLGKSIILKMITAQNMKILKSYNLKTNDYILGILYADMIKKELIQDVLENCKEQDVTVYVKLSPCSYLRSLNDSHSCEFKLTQDKIFEDNIIRLGFDIVKYE